MSQGHHGKELGVSDSRVHTPPAAPQPEQAADARLLRWAYERLPLSLLIALFMSPFLWPDVAFFSRRRR